MAPALHFDVVAKCSKSRARAATMVLPHGTVHTPVFMPVGTKASLKGLTPDQLKSLGCEIFLNNTYHLGLKPGSQTLESLGGTHKFQNWDRPILTDSGGFQMVSLLKLATVTESGVRFLSPEDNSPMMLTPEHSIGLQNVIGSDIIMQLDDVVSSLTTGPRVEEAMHRSIRWLDRCIAANKNSAHKQNLFCIIQGGLDIDLRRTCSIEMVKRDTPGIAIGGLSGGESKDAYFKVVAACTELLPENKPRYCMGVGYAEDLVVSVALGADMFDCVYPTRTARFGTAITKHGLLHLKKKIYRNDLGPLEDGCRCAVCTPKSQGGLGITRALLHLSATRDTAAAHCLTIHNVWYQLELMRQLRESIVQDAFPQFVREFFSNLYKDKAYPPASVEALRSVNIEL